MNSSFSLSSVLLFTPAIKRSFLNVILSYNHIIIVICIFVDYGHCDNPDSSHHIHPWSCWAAHFRASSMGECATQLNGFSLFSDVVALLQFCTGYFILKIDQFLRTVPLTDFLPGSISSVELRCSCCARSLEISAERSGETLLKTRAASTTAGISSGGRAGAVTLCIIKIWQHDMKILPNY